MNTMQIAFKFARAGGILGFFGFLRLQHKSDLPLKFYHADLVFSDGIAGTSDQRGVLLEKKNNFNGDYVVVALKATPEEEAIVRQWFEEKVKERAPYDWVALVSFLLPFRIDDPDGYYCSEALVVAMQTIGWFPEVNAVDMDPMILFTEIAPYVV